MMLETISGKEDTDSRSRETDCTVCIESAAREGTMEGLFKRKTLAKERLGFTGLAEDALDFFLVWYGMLVGIKTH